MNIATSAISTATTTSSAALRLLSFSSASSSSYFSNTLIPVYYWTRRNSGFTSFSPSRKPMLSGDNQNNPSPSAPEPPPEKPKPKPQPWLIVGLGNPGKVYSKTRHNVRTSPLSVSVFVYVESLRFIYLIFFWDRLDLRWWII